MCFCFPFNSLLLCLSIILCHKMQIGMMFCTISTYLIWFLCCRALVEREKAFGKFNFIVFSVGERLREHQILFEIFEQSSREGGRSRQAGVKHWIRKGIWRQKLFRHFLCSIEVPRRRSVFTNLSDRSKTETHAVHINRSVANVASRERFQSGWWNGLKWICKLSVKTFNVLAIELRWTYVFALSFRIVWEC